jgi:general secretion pathway protein G
MQTQSGWVRNQGDCPALPVLYGIERDGFTFIELLIVIAIIGILAAISVTSYNSYREKIKITSCVLGIGVIQKSIVVYYAETGKYPADLSEIGMDSMKDPWGNHYQYFRIANPTGSSIETGTGNGNGTGTGTGTGNSGSTGTGNSSSSGSGNGKGGSGNSSGSGGSGSGNSGTANSGSGSNGNSANAGIIAECRKDRNLVPINTDYDLYSMGADGKSVPPLTAMASRDDIIRANDGQYIGLASRY